MHVPEIPGLISIASSVTLQFAPDVIRRMYSQCARDPGLRQLAARGTLGTLMHATNGNNTRRRHGGLVSEPARAKIRRGQVNKKD